MGYLSRPWQRAVARVLVLAVAVAAVPVNCLAAGPPGPPPQSTSTLGAAVQHAIQHEAARVAKMSPNAARQAGAPAATSGSGFFKSKAGVLTLVLLAAGTGYALYSTSHDRIKTENVTYGGTWK